MSLSPGDRIGAYEVISQLGAGGMGEVYRARDTRLQRDVALKVLPETFAADRDRLARFEREAHVLASLAHANIAHIYGIEPGPVLVLEIVEGPTLADRIAEGPLPVGEAMAVARQIAAALDAAHEQGVIHRDLKPANIKVKDDGTVKVLDFGLAKFAPAAADAPSAVDATMSPTLSPAFTGVGMILGTAAYMAPEQARGRAVDKRADIWAFGCVLFEMLTGRRAFEGSDATEMIAAVVRAEPDWSALPAATPAPVRALLKRCLAKDPRQRLRDIGDVPFHLDATSEPAPAGRSPHSPWRLAAASTAIGLLLLAAGWAGWTLRPASPRPTARFSVTLEDFGPFSLPRQTIAVSERHLVYTSDNMLYLRPFDAVDAVAMRGTAATGSFRPHSPAFSADGDWIAYWAEGQIKRLAVAGGAPITLATVQQPPTGLSWAGDDAVLFAQGSAGIWRITGSGNDPEQIIRLNSGESAYGPQLLPDGRTVLFTVRQGNVPWDDALVVAQSLESGARTVLVQGGTEARYIGAGYLLYVRDGTLMAATFDPGTLAVGSPAPGAEDVAQAASSVSGTAHYSVSSDGTLVYLTGSSVADAVNRSSLVWVDRSGREEQVQAPIRAYRYPRIAPQGDRVALDLQDDERDIWVWHFRGETLSRVTVDPAIEQYAVWMPDGRRVLFGSGRVGTSNIFRQNVDGTGAVEQVTKHDNALYPMTVSPDGTLLVVREDTPTSPELMVVPLDGTGAIRPLVRTPFIEYNAEISPDGRWLAYQSTESGRHEVYVRPFPNVDDARFPVSSEGGTKPAWSRDGRELFYVTADGAALMAVKVADTPAFRAERPAKVLDLRAYVSGDIGTTANPGRNYDVSADGRRFLVVKDVPQRDTGVRPTVIVVQNWVDELKKKVPAR